MSNHLFVRSNHLFVRIVFTKSGKHAIMNKKVKDINPFNNKDKLSIIKKSLISKLLSSLMVLALGLEPRLLHQKIDFESIASTNFAMRARTN